MRGLINFMRSTWGRALRVTLGLVLLYVGLFAMGGMAGNLAGVIVAVVGLLPIAMGVWEPCLLEFILKPSK